MMGLHIRPFSPNDMEGMVQLSLLAWKPVYQSFQQVLGTKIYVLLFPDWKETQRTIVEKICREHEKTLVWVAEVHGIITGFIVYTLWGAVSQALSCRCPCFASRTPCHGKICLYFHVIYQIFG